MLARVVEVGIKPEKKQEIITTLQHELVPLLHRQSAFVGHEVGVREDDNSLVIAATYWQNRRDADAFYATPAYTNLVNRLRPHFTTDIKSVFCTVEISTAHRIAAGKAA